MRHSRDPLGIAQAAGGMIALGPIIVIAMGVTLAVYIVGEATKDVVEAAKRNKKLERKCQASLVQCISDPWQPPWNREIFGDRKQCQACFNYCMDKKYWPTDKCPLSN